MRRKLPLSLRILLGLGLGVLASLGLSQLTLSMFQISMDGMLGLHFSPAAAGKTILYFGLIFLLVMLLSGVQVSRSKLLDLMQGDRRNEPLRQRSLTWAVFQCVLGVVCLGVAYVMLLTFGMMILAMPMLCVPMLALGTVGTCSFPVSVRLCAAAGPEPPRFLPIKT